MLRRHLATLWTLTDGTRCDLILLAPSAPNFLDGTRWQIEVIKGADRLRSESFEAVDGAYTEAKRWLSHRHSSHVRSA
jgi:hypothetical protein